jgi:ATP-binding cassette, sub-family E, member 1
LPTPLPGKVLGIVGMNGTGKSTALKILSGKTQPNLGKYEETPEWGEILKVFKNIDKNN